MHATNNPRESNHWSLLKGHIPENEQELMSMLCKTGLLKV